MNLHLLYLWSPRKELAIVQFCKNTHCAGFCKIAKRKGVRRLKVK